ncbi:hypothetical protein AGQ62_24630 [Salmonella enterica subsp. enterica]|nr:hypothetical protein AGQ62_24630 [Salmonella enterica subsp. enterica]
MNITLKRRGRAHEGTGITARGVDCGGNNFEAGGLRQYSLVYKGTTEEEIAPLIVRIELAKHGKEVMLSLFSLPIMPEKFWTNHKRSDPL